MTLAWPKPFAFALSFLASTLVGNRAVEAKMRFP